MNNLKTISGSWEDEKEEPEPEISKRSENKQQMKSDRSQPQSQSKSKFYHISLDEALADRKVSIINNFVDISGLSDIYLVMDLPNLTKCKFSIQNDEFCHTLSYLKFRYVKYSDGNDNLIPDHDNQLLLGTSVFWNTFMLPALTHYCFGRYMRRSKLLYHNRRLDYTNFSFTIYHKSENITIRLANYRLSIHIDYDYPNPLNIKSLIYKVKLNNNPISATRTYKMGRKKHYYYLDIKDGKTNYDLKTEGRLWDPRYREKDLSLETMINSLECLFY